MRELFKKQYRINIFRVTQHVGMQAYWRLVVMLQILPTCLRALEPLDKSDP